MPRLRNQSLLISARGGGPSSTVLACTFRVLGYSRSVYGGPRAARVAVSGDEGALLAIRTLLRSPVEIYDEEADLVWWGYVHRATVRLGNVSVSWSLDEMANRVAVVFTRQTPTAGGSKKAQTPWAEQSTSILEYGVKERLITLSDGDDVGAESYRDSWLARIGLPVREVELANGAAGVASGELECRGWFETLGWQYYAQPAGLVSYSRAGGAAEALPLSPGAVAQSFVLADAVGWDATAIALRMRSSDGPTDTLTLSLHADAAGAPGATLGSATIAASSLAGSATWGLGSLAAPVALAPATTYWVQAQRSLASPDGSSISLDIDEGAGYAGGAYRIYSGSWAPRAPNASLMFQVLGEQDTGLQVPPLVAAAGQFLTGGAVVQQVSGVLAGQYRAGERTGLQELTDLLNLGTADNRRMLARVTASRQLIVEPEPAMPGPASATPSYYLTRKNEILTTNGIQVVSASCPVGIWVRPQALLDQIVGVDPIFIDEAEYDVASDSLRLTARDQRDPRDLARVKDR